MSTVLFVLGEFIKMTSVVIDYLLKTLLIKSLMNLGRLLKLGPVNGDNVFLSLKLRAQTKAVIVEMQIHGLKQ